MGAWGTSRARRWLVRGAAIGASAVLAAPAAAAPSISGADTDVWNMGAPDVTYVLTGVAPLRIYWTVPGVGSGSGASPLTVTLPGVPDGRYTLVAGDATGSSRRAFRVKRTPPAVVINSPTPGARVPVGSGLLASYSCAGAQSCTGPVASGAPLDTSRLGPVAFRVVASDDAGNSAAASADFVVVDPAAGGSKSPPALRPPRGSSAPPTINARALRPRARTILGTRRPMLAWTPRRGARLYNVQVFRLRGSAATKVLSAFPSAARLLVPAGRLVWGERYLWRVWPYLRHGYPRTPLGQSYFTLRLKTASRPVLAAGSGPPTAPPAPAPAAPAAGGQPTPPAPATGAPEHPKQDGNGNGDRPQHHGGGGGD